MAYFEEEESGLWAQRFKAFCDNKAGPPLGQKMQTTILAEKSENPAMEGRVSYLNNLQSLEKAFKSKAGTRALGPNTSF